MKQSIWERAARRLELPVDILAGLPKVEIRGCREIYIENHHGLLEYGDNEIHINGGDMVIKLTGQGFVIKAMNALELRVEGLLFHMEFVF